MPDVRNAATIADLRELARKRLPEFAFIPMETGSGGGSGPTRNIEGLRSRHLKPRMLVDVSDVRQETTVFGRSYASPFGISAVGYAGNLRRHADQLLAEAAREANIPFMLSGGSSASVEEIARIAPDHVWQQLYAARDPAITEHFVGRARDAGVQVLVYTVDSPVPPRNDWLVRAGIALPARVRQDRWPYILWQALTHPGWSFDVIRNGGLPPMESWAPYAPPGSSTASIARAFQAQVPSVQSWASVERVRALWPGKLVIKGLLHPDDAARARDCGADAVTVSNHGGNTLDCLGPSIGALPPIAEATAGRMPLFFDGGIRRGSDILIARALGADFAFVGRATLYGVIAGGLEGAAYAIGLLQHEIARTLALIGCPDAAAIDNSFVE